MPSVTAIRGMHAGRLPTALCVAYPFKNFLRLAPQGADHRLAVMPSKPITHFAGLADQHLWNMQRRPRGRQLEFEPVSAFSGSALTTTREACGRCTSYKRPPHR